MWRLYISFFDSEKSYAESIQSIASAAGGYDLLLNHYNESHKTGPKAIINVKTDGICCAIILCFLHSYIDIPSKYQIILSSLKNEIESKSNTDRIRSLLSAISLIATTPNNRILLYNNGFHTIIFNYLVDENSNNDGKMYASQALCCMTCEESSNLKNNILNEERFGKLKELMEKIICSSPQSIKNIFIAQKNAIIIENIFLILSNMLIGNENALTPIINSGFITYILNHLSPDTDDKQRQNAGNIKNQQKAALLALHSITFHQTDHINSLIKMNNILTCVKIMMNENNKEIIELAISGVLYNIAVKGNAGSNEQKVEVTKNNYFSDFKEEEGLMEIICNASKTGPSTTSTSLSSYNIRTKQYSTLILGQLYRNKKLEEKYQHIIISLKELKNGNDKDMTFKATNTLEILCENKGIYI
jgi:hypothetical protein